MVMTGRAGKFFSWVLIFLLSALALLFANHLAAAASSNPSKKVLLLYSYQSILPGNVEWDEGIRSALKGPTSEPLEFYTEFLDLARFPENSYLQNLINLLKNKYAGRKIDLLIPVRDPAFQFLSAHGSSIFPGVPIVFCGAERSQVQSLKRLENTTGVTFQIDVKGTLAAALKLHPQTRQVAVVGGTTKPDRVFQQVAQEALRQYEDQIKVISLIDLPLTEILQRVAKLPPHTIILYLCMFRDSAGNDFLPQNALALVAQAANAPVYGLWETLLRHGIVGGHLMRFKAQGSMTGKLGRRVLNGEKPENIPIVNEGTNFYMFDWRQLKRWGIRERDLPPGSEVRFKEPSLWEEHQAAIIGISAAFCLLAFLILVLLINLGRRRRAEQALTVSNRVLEIVNRHNELSALLKEFAAEIKGFLNCEAVGIRLLDEEGNIPYYGYVGFSKEFYEMESPLSIKSDQCMCINVIKGTTDAKLPFYTPGGSFYMNGTTRFLATVSPEDKGSTRNVCNAIGYESVALVPIRLGQQILGLIHLADRKENMVPLERVESLEKIALQLGAALQRVKIQEELRRSGETLEQRVKQRTAELEFANRELESFSYSVSHDLKTPLRAIGGFSQMLVSQHAGQLDNEGHRLVKVITDNTELMNTLVDDLLTLSRLGRQAIKKSNVNLAAIAGQVFERLQAQTPERDLQLTIGDLPQGFGDRSLLSHVLENLLANAIKFTKTRKPAVIEVGGRDEENATVYFVKDNGVGFDERYADKLFSVFQRLHKPTEYEGTGVGLAIVQRIIHRHGGRVWAEGKVDAGATFYFALPKNEA